VRASPADARPSAAGASAQERAGVARPHPARRASDIRAVVPLRSVARVCHSFAVVRTGGRVSNWTKLMVAGTVLLSAAGDASAGDVAPTCTCDPAQACGVDPCGGDCGAGCGAASVCVANSCVPSASCDALGFSALTQAAELDRRADGARLEFRADSRALIPFQRLVIQSFERLGGPVTPGVYPITDAGYADCGLCVVAYDGCSPAGCARAFLADAGTVVIESVASGDFTATLRDAHLREVYINDSTLASTPIPTGDAWCVERFDAHAPMVEHHETDTCAAAGTGREIGDKIGDFTLSNCLGEPVALHDRCGSARAVWIVLSAGWCSACAEHLPEVAEVQAAQRELGLEVLVLLGEDDAGGEPTPAYCAQYAEDMGLDPAAVVIDWSGDASFATIEDHLNLYGDGSLSLPWDGVLDGSTMRYVWSGARDGGSANAVINELVAK